MLNMQLLLPKTKILCRTETKFSSIVQKENKRKCVLLKDSDYEQLEASLKH